MKEKRERERERERKKHAQTKPLLVSDTCLWQVLWITYEDTGIQNTLHTFGCCFLMHSIV